MHLLRRLIDRLTGSDQARRVDAIGAARQTAVEAQQRAARREFLDANRGGHWDAPTEVQPLTTLGQQRTYRQAAR